MNNSLENESVIKSVNENIQLLKILEFIKLLYLIILVKYYCHKYNLFPLTEFYFFLSKKKEKKEMKKVKSKSIRISLGAFEYCGTSVRQDENKFRKCCSRV